MDHETTEKISNVSMTSLTNNPALAIIEKIDNDTSFLLVELAMCCSLATEMFASDPNPHYHCKMKTRKSRKPLNEPQLLRVNNDH
jgi:hypothetical protein